MSRPTEGPFPWYRRCGHPGCETKMHKNTSTYDAGFCAKHGGMAKGREIVRAEPLVAPERPGVRVVEVATISSCGSAAGGGRAKVSLAREPWA